MKQIAPLPETDIQIITLTRGNTQYVERLSRALMPQVEDLGVSCIRFLVNNGVMERSLTATAKKHLWRVVNVDPETSFSAGNNRAAQLSSTTWLLLVNDDLIPHPTMLERLWRRRSDADVMGVLALQSDGTVNHAGVRVLPRLDHLGRGHQALLYQGLPPQEVDAVTFACALIRRSLWDGLNGLDECYWYGFEDIDFCLRAKSSESRILCNMEAVVQHDECGTRARGGEYERDNFSLFRSRWSNYLEAEAEKLRSGASPPTRPP